MNPGRSHRQDWAKGVKAHDTISDRQVQFNFSCFFFIFQFFNMEKLGLEAREGGRQRDAGLRRSRHDFGIGMGSRLAPMAGVSIWRNALRRLDAFWV